MNSKNKDNKRLRRIFSIRYEFAGRRFLYVEIESPSTGSELFWVLSGQNVDIEIFIRIYRGVLTHYTQYVKKMKGGKTNSRSKERSKGTEFDSRITGELRDKYQIVAYGYKHPRYEPKGDEDPNKVKEAYLKRMLQKLLE